MSAAILRQIAKYKTVLESYSRPLLDFIDWEAMPKGNVRVKNETTNYYRYFDATAHAEFLYASVQETIEHDLPDEVAYLKAYDRFSQDAQAILDMPDQKIGLLHHFLKQGKGHLSKRARTKEFAALTDAEIAQIEGLYAESFGKLDDVQTA